MAKSSKTTSTQSPETEPAVVAKNGFLRNCVVRKREGDDSDLFVEKGDQVIASLDGYAIIPKEDLDRIQSLFSFRTFEDLLESDPDTLVQGFIKGNEGAKVVLRVASEKCGTSLTTYAIPITGWGQLFITESVRIIDGTPVMAITSFAQKGISTIYAGTSVRLTSDSRE